MGRSRSILFVCLGNICRSPMAAGFARELLGEHLHAESAGIDPVYDRATPEAIRVMQERGIDISAHRSRPVRAVDLDRTDHVVALTPAIASMLPGMKQPGKVVTWNVADPYGGDLARYRACAAEIERELRALAASLDGGTRD